MPHEGERSGITTGLKRLVNSERAKILLGRTQKIVPAVMSSASTGISVERPATEDLPRFVIAIDGSQGLIEVEEGFPGAEMGVVTVASVMIDLHKLRQTRDNGVPNPRKFHDLYQPHGIELFVPSTNMVTEGHSDARESYRAEFFRALGDERLADDGESLLETYEALLTLRSDDGANKLSCPLLGSCTEQDKGHHYHQAFGNYACVCGSKEYFSTDALRIHESFIDAGSNPTVITESRSVLEHLVLVNYLRYFERKKMWASLCDVAFVMDGPLSVSGHPAWLAMSIKQEIQRLTKLSLQDGGTTPIIFGIEKTGMFQEHLMRLDRTPRPNAAAVVATTGSAPERRPDPRHLPRRGRLDPGQVILVNDDYTKKNVIFKYEAPGAGPFKWYGQTTQYGRKALYKTRSNALITAMPAFLHGGDDQMDTAELKQFPNLGLILSLLDALVSNAFKDATIPLVLAHAEASIPARANEGVLKRFVREHQKETQPL